MPIPIMLNKNPDGNSVQPIDYSFLMQSLNTPNRSVTAGNAEASMIYKMWEVGGNKNRNSIKITSDMGISDVDIQKLKDRGFIAGSKDDMKLTSRGRSVIVTMILAEPNRFSEASKKKSYTEILASTNAKGKIRMPKFASNQDNNIRLG